MPYENKEETRKEYRYAIINIALSIFPKRKKYDKIYRGASEKKRMTARTVFKKADNGAKKTCYLHC